MNIFFASGNTHKKDEMQALFAGHQICIPKDSGIDFNPEETGTSFIENSMIKARALWDIVKEPILADDSGICVDILDGAPGIYSARFGGTHISTAERNELLIHTVCEKTVSADSRCSAYFVCALVLFFNPNRFYIVQETLEGTLVLDKQGRGQGGFGYDPLLFLPQYGKTVAELTVTEKNNISHRAKAAAALKKLL